MILLLIELNMPIMLKRVTNGKELIVLIGICKAYEVSKISEYRRKIPGPLSFCLGNFR